MLDITKLYTDVIHSCRACLLKVQLLYLWMRHNMLIKGAGNIELRHKSGFQVPEANTSASTVCTPASEVSFSASGVHAYIC